MDNKVFNEDAVSFALYKNYIAKNSKVFFKFHHNIAIKEKREWDYWCVPEIDVIEVRQEGIVVAYELKGARKYKRNEPNWPGFYDGIGQAMAYLDLPKSLLKNSLH